MESVLDLNGFDMKVASGELKLIHCGRSSRSYLGAENEYSKLVFKEFHSRNRLDRVKQILFGSRAKRAARGTFQLAQNNFSVLQVRGIIEDNALCKSERSILITKFENDAIALTKAIPAMSLINERRMLLKLLAAEIAKMHLLGRAHDDMNLGNILLRKTSAGYQVIWSDIDRVRISPWGGFKLTSRQVLKNFRQLAKIDVGLSLKEKLYFFYSYTSLRSVKRSEAKMLLMQVIQEIEAKGLIQCTS